MPKALEYESTVADYRISHGEVGSVSPQASKGCAALIPRGEKRLCSSSSFWYNGIGCSGSRSFAEYSYFRLCSVSAGVMLQVRRPECIDIGEEA